MKGFEYGKKQAALTESVPEFYERLQHLQISILPKKKKAIYQIRFKSLTIR